ncbi:MAG: hypothetical protein ND866_00855 [Pyrinomonadaceae bacterium]|nr:hypothetical protein [Pyrinomonadaceae bacterium]
MIKTPMSLVHILIGKSIFETLLVVSLAVVFFLDAFPRFQGWGEATPHAIAGWVVNNRAPWHRVEVQLFVDDQFAGRAVANQSRTDVVAAGWSEDEWHGYTIPISSLQAGVHEARVYALHDSGLGARKTMQLVGDPIRFVVSQNGTLAPLESTLGETSATIR